MQAILISIQPRWCELIASGKKTVEVRKTRPIIEPPFKCYIYQTRQTWVYGIYSRIADWQGKIIGEFICRQIDYWRYQYQFEMIHIEDMSRLSCVSLMELLDYLGNPVNKNGFDKTLYAWHISELVIYDEPKELSEYSLKIPPQSWCYVEEMQWV